MSEGVNRVWTCMHLSMISMTSPIDLTHKEHRRDKVACFVMFTFRLPCHE